MKSQCEVCCGSGFIRLPLYKQAAVTSLRDSAQIQSIDETSRQFPCPECSEMVPQDRVAVLYHHIAVADVVSGDAKFRGHVRRRCARGLADALIDGRFIRFSEARDDTPDRAYRMQATIGVIAPSRVASIEERAAQNQEALARRVIERARNAILDWASHYTGPSGNIPKGLACRELDDALHHEMMNLTYLEAVRNAATVK
jgi:hypothetical protein